MSISDIILSVYFVLLAVLNIAFSKWLLKLVIQSAGVGLDEANKYFHDRSGHKNQQRQMYKWLYQNADDKNKFKRLYFLYFLCIFPTMLCISLALMNLAMPQVTVIRFLAIIMTIIIVTIIVAGVVYKRKTKK